MLARLQRHIAFALLALALGGATVAVVVGHPAWAPLAAVLIGVGYALVLGAEFVLLWRVQTAEAAPLPTARQLLTAWWGEVRTAPPIFLWRQPFRARAEPDHLPAAARGRRGVVLVHGLFCNRAFWTPWMRRLRARGVPVVAPDLEPVLASIDAYAEQIEAAVRAVQDRTGRPVVVVGHSMGGLAVRAWHAKHGAPGRVHRVVTIGTPHHGTWMARFGHGPGRQEMSLSSAWLARLVVLEASAHPASTTCFYGHCDNIVFPAEVACLPAARNLHVPATAHVHMAFHPSVFAAVCEALGDDGP